MIVNKYIFSKILIIVVDSGQTTADSDQSNDETTSDETRYEIGSLGSKSTLTTSPTLDEPDHIMTHLPPLLDRLCVMK